jgi:uncharacterized protein involved in exopolysaccharide biosynthesis
MNPQDQPLPAQWNDLEDDEVDVWGLWETLWSEKWWIVGVALVAGLLGAAYSLSQAQWYQSKVVLVAVPQAQALGAPAPTTLPSGAGGISASPQVPIATLRSLQFAEDFITKYELMPALFADAWDAGRQAWKPLDPDETPDLRDGVDLFSSDVLAVDSDARTGLITLTVSWTDAELAKSWADAIVTEANDRLRTQALIDAERNVEHLKAELLKATSATVQQSIGRLLDQEMQKVMLVKCSQEFAFKIIDPARAPKHHFKPDRMRITLIALACGALAGAAFAFLRKAARARREQLAAEAASSRAAVALDAPSPAATPAPAAVHPTGRGRFSSLP